MEYEELHAYIEAAQYLRRARSITDNDEMNKVGEAIEKHVHDMIDEAFSDWEDAL